MWRGNICSLKRNRMGARATPWRAWTERRGRRGNAQNETLLAALALMRAKPVAVLYYALSSTSRSIHWETRVEMWIERRAGQVKRGGKTWQLSQKTTTLLLSHNFENIFNLRSLSYPTFRAGGGPKIQFPGEEGSQSGTFRTGMGHTHQKPFLFLAKRPHHRQLRCLVRRRLESLAWHPPFLPPLPLPPPSSLCSQDE